MNQRQTKALEKILKAQRHDVDEIFANMAQSTQCPEICLAAVAKNPYVFQWLRSDMIDKAICLQMLSSHEGSYRYLVSRIVDDESAKHLLSDDEIIDQAIQTSFETLNYIPQDKMNSSLVHKAISNNPSALYYVPEAYRTYEIYKAALEQNGALMSLVPQDIIDEGLMLNAVKTYGLAIEYKPELINEAIAMAAVTQEGNALKHVPEALRSEALHRAACKQNEAVYGTLAENDRTLAVTEGFFENGNYLSMTRERFNLIPESLHSKDLFIQLFEHNTLSEFNCIPLEYYSEEMLIKGLIKERSMLRYKNSDGIKIENIPAEFKTPEFYMKAIEAEAILINDVPEDLQTPEMVRTAISKNITQIADIKSDLLEYGVQGLKDAISSNDGPPYSFINYCKSMQNIDSYNPKGHYQLLNLVFDSHHISAIKQDNEFVQRLNETLFQHISLNPELTNTEFDALKNIIDSIRGDEILNELVISQWDVFETKFMKTNDVLINDFADAMKDKGIELEDLLDQISSRYNQRSKVSELTL